MFAYNQMSSEISSFTISFATMVADPIFLAFMNGINMDPKDENFVKMMDKS